MIKLEDYYNQAALEKDLDANCGRPYQQCSISVMDTIADPNITFDENGICNYYYEYVEAEKSQVFKGEAGQVKLTELAETIKKAGKGKRYDCITGVSGGVDSTYLALLAKELGLRPLVVHFDNGWNSEKSVRNVENIISKLGFDLYTLVVDWEEFKDLQLAYLKSSVVDIEVITDHAIIATMNKLAIENGIKYILSGANIMTELVLPSYWVHSKSDYENIIDIHNKFGKVKLKTYPKLSFFQKKLILEIKKINTVYPLNFLDYQKEKIKDIIKEKLDWEDYGGKHFESIWTKFYQGYILPRKFNIDKRKAHLSNLIFCGQIDKSYAISQLKLNIIDPTQLQQDYNYVIKKLEIDSSYFESLMNNQRIEHNKYRTEQPIWRKIPLIKPLEPIWRKIRYGK